jgi:hypothetical protein
MRCLVRFTTLGKRFETGSCKSCPMAGRVLVGTPCRTQDMPDSTVFPFMTIFQSLGSKVTFHHILMRSSEQQGLSLICLNQTWTNSSRALNMLKCLKANDNKHERTRSTLERHMRTTFLLVSAEHDGSEEVMDFYTCIHGDTEYIFEYLVFFYRRLLFTHPGFSKVAGNRHKIQKIPRKWLNQKTNGTIRKCSSRAFQ